MRSTQLSPRLKPTAAAASIRTAGEPLLFAELKQQKQRELASRNANATSSERLQLAPREARASQREQIRQQQQQSAQGRAPASESIAATSRLDSAAQHSNPLADDQEQQQQSTIVSPVSSFENIESGDAAAINSAPQHQQRRQVSAPPQQTAPMSGANQSSSAAADELAALRAGLVEMQQHQQTQQQQVQQQMQQLVQQQQQVMQVLQSQQQQQQDQSQQQQQQGQQQQQQQGQQQQQPDGNDGQQAAARQDGNDPDSSSSDDDGDDESADSDSGRRDRERRRNRRSLLPRRRRSGDDPIFNTAQADGSATRNEWSIKPHAPSTYDGAKTGVRAFVHGIDCALQWNPPMTGRQQVVFASSFLTDRARTWLAAEEARDKTRTRELADWTSMRRSMLAYFEPTQLEAVVRAKLESMLQTKSAAGYVGRFNEELMKLEVGPDTRTAMSWFRRGLKDDVGIELATRKFVTLEDMQQAAMEVDDALHVFARRGKSSSSRRSSDHLNQAEMSGDESDDKSQASTAKAAPAAAKSGSTDLTEQLSKLQQQLNNLSTKGKQKPRRIGPNPNWTAEQKQRYANKECIGCGGKGHYVRNCPHRATTQQPKD